IPSQMAKLNDASLATVSASAPFDPLPENYKGEKLELRIVFRYAYLPEAPFKELYESAQRAVANQNYTSAAQLLETLVAQDPDYTNAWNYLGWIYNRLHKYDKAEDSLKKAIEVNPRDVFAYNNLGQAYAYQKRYDQAIPQYLKQLDINKNDRYANANLGRVYLELKQYDNAISALKSGATADPKDPTVFYNLGRAYAKNNQMDEAKEAFKKSVDLEPVPMRFNNVAYQMAVLNVDLHTAQHYAETGLGDRKSTRLNSSHLGISYAVFCLKKTIASAHAHGATITYLDGNVFIDFTGGVGCLNVRHTHPHVVAAAVAQVERFTHSDVMVFPY